MKKGELARQSIIEGITNLFKQQDSYVGFQDKKIYVNAQDGFGGEIIQFAISLTMPKNPITIGERTKKENPNDWTNEEPSTELSKEDEASIERLKEMLGI